MLCGFAARTPGERGRRCRESGTLYEEDYVAPTESYGYNVPFSNRRLQLQPGLPFPFQCSFKTGDISGIGFVAPSREIARYGAQVAAHALLYDDVCMHISFFE